ncbi:leucyl aminopeptidase [Zophobihabitans entericus]|uniref:Probable cytosol aminopeptidase n=1 Tax=Zophobihabitans entericus TaxID=1635327 RepID=A0A6G9IDW8_9GAMM|nr:leucyl aminopeptidase [Zophobihabitans entericus]QIQ22027.1 leucyl aminopeptidase [Zophobihabitans entericus]
MKFSIISEIKKQKIPCLVVGLFESDKLSPAIKQLDTISEGWISQLIKKGEISTKLGDTTLLYQVPNLLVDKLLFVGCGKEADFNEKEYKQFVIKATGQIITKQISDVVFLLSDLNKSKGYQFARQLVEEVHQQVYRFDQFKVKKKQPAIALSSVKLAISGSKENIKQAKLGLEHGLAISSAINATKDLANLPPNICNAAYLAAQGQQLAKSHTSIKTTVVGEAGLKKLKMGAYLAVGEGSANESMMTIMEYQGAANKKAKPIVLVGKGLTFDSGGISIKPAAGMDEMKYDMCGAASVFGVMQAIAELKLPVNVTGVMAGCENMPGSKAYRPGDILTTMSGQTVEVMNTDAEGRLVLCDVLTYVERFNPEAVIDIATLTGACIVALGHHYTGVIANDDELAARLVTASKQASDKAWQLPMDDDFQKQIDSPFADMANAAGRDGGTITAGCFLARFTEKYQWAHLDIAGTAWKSGAAKGATGRPVAMLVQYLLNRVGKN